MAFRISNADTTRLFIDQMFRQRNSLVQVQQQIASGMKVEKPSDDPTRASTISQLQSTLQRLDRHKERIALATNMLSQQDSGLDAAENILERAKEIATAAANETLSPELRANMAAEVFGLRDSIVGIANTKIDGNYIYGQADDDDPPFDADTYVNPADPTDPASVRYVFDAEDGTDVSRSIQVSDSDSIRVTSSGGDVFSNTIAVLERLGRTLKGYQSDLDGTTGLPDGNGTAYTFPADFHQQTSDLSQLVDALNDASGDIEGERSSVGSRMNQLDQILQTVTAVRGKTEEARSSIQDVDVFSAASDFSNLQIGLQALLASGSQINNLSLLNYL